MENKRILCFVGLLIVVVIGFFAYLVYDKKFNKNKAISEAPPIDKVLEEQKSEAKVSETVGNQVAKNGEPELLLAKIPDLNRPINIPSSTPTPQKEDLTSKIKEITALLKEDSNLFNQWVDLGLLRKAIDDYEGAREIWEYANAIRPNNSISFNNVATLYGYYLHNNELAEKNYLKSIENDPKYPYFYVQLSYFYLEVLNSKEKAKEILEKGLKAVPGDENIKSALKNLGY